MRMPIQTKFETSLTCAPAASPVRYGGNFLGSCHQGPRPGYAASKIVRYSTESIYADCIQTPRRCRSTNPRLHEGLSLIRNVHILWVSRLWRWIRSSILHTHKQHSHSQPRQPMPTPLTSCLHLPIRRLSERTDPSDRPCPLVTFSFSRESEVRTAHKVFHSFMGPY